MHWAAGFPFFYIFDVSSAVPVIHTTIIGPGPPITSEIICGLHRSAATDKQQVLIGSGGMIMFRCFCKIRRSHDHNGALEQPADKNCDDGARADHRSKQEAKPHEINGYTGTRLLCLKA